MLSQMFQACSGLQTHIACSPIVSVHFLWFYNELPKVMESQTGCEMQRSPT